jgi:type IV pilus assembly protein PilV
MTEFRNMHAARGFSMLEILVTILILLLGLLGLAGLQTRAHTAELESYQRAQALILASKMVDAIRSNRRTAQCFAVTDAATGTPFAGTTGTGYAGPLACAASTAAENTLANDSFAEWDEALQGAAETKSGASIGAMLGARGCVSYDATTELIDPATGGITSGTGLYTVAVAWQGLNDIFASTANCANGLYGSELKRRVVTMSFRIGHLL